MFKIGGSQPAPQAREPEHLEVIPAETRPAVALIDELVTRVGGIDPGTDIDDQGLAERDAGMASFSTLPADEKHAVLQLIQMEEPDLLRMVQNSGAMLGQSRESRLAREARLALVHRMTLRGDTLERMSIRLGISISRVAQLKKVVNERIRNQISRVDFGLYAGQQMSFYQQVKYTALSLSEDKSMPATAKMSALVLALRAAKDEQGFLRHCGVFKQFTHGDDLIKRLQTEDNGTGGSANTMTDIAMAFKKMAVIAAKGGNLEEAVDAVLVEENKLWEESDVFDADDEDGSPLNIGQ